MRLLISPVSRLAFLIAGCLAAALSSPSRPVAADNAAASSPLEYNRDVRPILANNCFACHGADSAARQADLRLDQRDVAIEMGAIAPGQPQDSELLRRILSDDPEEAMPPPETKKQLTAEQKDILRRWIEQGAAYQPHWSLIPPRQPAVPDVRDAAWVRHPIDNFVLARLEQEGLAPAPEADRRTLARRAALDLTGLPPTPEQVEAFVGHPAPDAYEQYVDGLLRSDRWGEHRARYWLDYARYADTNGIHFDNFREMWSYRDWVIDAFNRNMPYDEFTIENLAGDLLPNPTMQQLIGSGFNRCHMTTNEGGIIDEEYLVLYTRDRTDTVSQVWLGMTAGCAVCHDHKFDPLSQREFYELAAFFNNTTQAAKDGNVKDTPPIIVVPSPEDGERWNAVGPILDAARARVEARRTNARPEFDAWLAAATAETILAREPTAGLTLRAPLNEGEGQAVTVFVDGEQRSVPLSETASWIDRPDGRALQPEGAALELADFGDFERDQPFTCAAWIKAPASDDGGALCSRMNTAQGLRGWDFSIRGRRAGAHIISKWPDNAIKVLSKQQFPANEWVHVAVSYDGSGQAAGVDVYYNGEPQATNVERDKLAGTVRTEVPFKLGQRSADSPISGVGLYDLRIYNRVLSAAEVDALGRQAKFAATLAKSPEARTPAELDQFYAFWLGSQDTAFRELTDDVSRLERERADIQARGTVAHVMHEKDESAMAFILARGEYDKRGEQVVPGTPAAMPPLPGDSPRNRLGFARWLLLPEHPLTARVTVNRCWQEVFGTGLVKTAGDFGVMGELPTHPELLDWLAVEFRESGWDVKRLFRDIVTSATYRQSAQMTPRKLELDPANRLLSRGPRFRMDAEMIRDYALATSGLLSGMIGGPSVKPYQPEGVWEAIAMNISNTRAYERDKGEGLYRRSMYWFWKRMAPPASMDIFNAPNREFCVVRRERTNTPLQALVTLNDEQFVEAARYLAELALKEGGTEFEQRVNFIGLRLVARPFGPEEQAIIRQSLAELLAHYEAQPEEADKLLGVGETSTSPAMNRPELAAWTMLTNQLMNLDEVLCK